MGRIKIEHSVLLPTMGRVGGFVATGKIVHDDAEDFAGTFVNMTDFFDKLQVVKANPFSVDANTKALYHLDEGEGTTGDNAEGTAAYDLASIDRWSVNGKFGTPCIDFERSSAEKCYNNTVMDTVPANGTFECWFKPESINTQQNILIAIADGTHFFALYMGTDEKIYWWLYDGTSKFKINSTTILSAGNWYHIAGTWGAGGAELFINFVSEATSGSTSKLPDNAANVFNMGTTGFEIDGLVDEVRISTIQRDPSSYDDGSYESQSIYMEGATWGKFSWTENLDGATLVAKVRGSDNDIDWTEWQTLSNGDIIALGQKDYLQYGFWLTNGTENTDLDDIEIEYAN